MPAVEHCPMTESSTDPKQQLATDKGQAFGQAFVGARAIFDGLSSKDRLELLKSLGGLYGHRVLPGLGAGPQQGPVQAVKAGRVPKAPAQPKGEKSAEQIRLQKEIAVVNGKISAASKEANARLPAEHPLLARREELFRALRAQKSKAPPA